MKFSGNVDNGTRNRWLNFGDVLDDTDEMRSRTGFYTYDAPLGCGASTVSRTPNPPHECRACTREHHACTRNCTTVWATWRKSALSECFSSSEWVKRQGFKLYHVTEFIFVTAPFILDLEILLSVSSVNEIITSASVLWHTCFAIGAARVSLASASIQFGDDSCLKNVP